MYNQEVSNFNRIQNRMKIKIFLIVALAATVVFISKLSFSQEATLDEEVITAGNKVILNVYEKIFNEREQHSELKDFNSNVLKKQNNGILLLYYRYDEYMSIKRDELYHFGFTMNKLGEMNPFHEVGQSFKFVYPILGVQIVGARADTIIKKKQFDFLPIVEETITGLWRLEQDRLPYQLKVSPSKRLYKVNEKITLTLQLANMLRYNQKLKDIDSNALKFQINENLYGSQDFDTEQIKKAKTVIFNPHQKRSRKIYLDGFEDPGVYEISCTYLLPYQGVFPQDVVRITVTE